VCSTHNTHTYTLTYTHTQTHNHTHIHAHLQDVSIVAFGISRAVSDSFVLGRECEPKGEERETEMKNRTAHDIYSKREVKRNNYRTRRVSPQPMRCEDAGREQEREKERQRERGKERTTNSEVSPDSVSD